MAMQVTICGICGWMVNVIHYFLQQAVTQLLRDQLDMTPHTPYPCMLKTSDNSCFVLIHVDDILVVGRRDIVMEKLVGHLKSKYEIAAFKFMEKPDGKTW